MKWEVFYFVFGLSFMKHMAGFIGAGNLFTMLWFSNHFNMIQLGVVRPSALFRYHWREITYHWFFLKSLQQHWAQFSPHTGLQTDKSWSEWKKQASQASCVHCMNLMHGSCTLIDRWLFLFWRSAAYASENPIFTLAIFMATRFTFLERKSQTISMMKLSFNWDKTLASNPNSLSCHT